MSNAFVCGVLNADLVLVSVGIYSSEPWNLTYVQLLPPVEGPSFAEAKRDAEFMAASFLPVLKHLFDWEAAL